MEPPFKHLCHNFHISCFCSFVDILIVNCVPVTTDDKEGDT